MAVIKCKMCGGDLNIVEGASTAECEYCGSVQTIPKVDDEKKLTLFARANRLRIACEFDKAAGIYEAIVADFPEEAEAYWGLVLCKYGIEYVDDPGSGKKIPTCHRSSFDSVMEDGDFEQALENADGTARKVYREEAKQIEEIRKGIISVSSNEQPYDIFICYKETDENGDRTLDSVLAQDVYDALTDKGYRVFFSRITLEDKLGTEYEPYIFAALNSAKIMLAFGTDYEYFNAVWVKNEWSRFLKLMAKDKTKHLIPCYKGIDAYDMPKEFAKLQAQDLGKVGAMQDLLRGIEKILPRQTETKTIVQEAIVTANNPSIESYLKRVFMFLEDSDWKSANEYCEKVLDIDPENAQAYLGKLLADLHLSKEGQLATQLKSFEDLSNYQKAIRFSGEELRGRLTGYVTTVNNRIEAEQLARKQHQEEMRILKEKKTNELLTIRKKLSVGSKLFTTKDWNTCALMPDNTIEIVGRLEDEMQDVTAWRNIVAFSVGSHHIVGLKSDGTVVAAGNSDAKRGGLCEVSTLRDIITIKATQFRTIALRSNGTVAIINNHSSPCDVSSWHNIIDIASDDRHVLGLRSDGTVAAVGDNEDGRCNVGDWHDIVAIYATYCQSIGLKSNGTVVAVGRNKYGSCNVSDWKDIIAVSAESAHTAGLKYDGSVVAVGYNEDGRCNVSNWHDIVDISVGGCHTVGLKSDGTVVAVGRNLEGQCNVDSWRNIVAISAWNYNTVGLRSDGTVVAVGENKEGQCNVNSWRLFENYDNLEQERLTARKKREEQDQIIQKEQAEAKKIAAERRAAGKCQHCGGELKGLFSKKCVSCSKLKDY